MFLPPMTTSTMPSLRSPDVEDFPRWIYKTGKSGWTRSISGWALWAAGWEQVHPEGALHTLVSLMGAQAQCCSEVQPEFLWWVFSWGVTVPPLCSSKTFFWKRYWGRFIAHEDRSIKNSHSFPRAAKGDWSLKIEENPSPKELSWDQLGFP